MLSRGGRRAACALTACAYRLESKCACRYCAAAATARVAASCVAAAEGVADAATVDVGAFEGGEALEGAAHGGEDAWVSVAAVVVEVVSLILDIDAHCVAHGGSPTRGSRASDETEHANIASTHPTGGAIPRLGDSDCVASLPPSMAGCVANRKADSNRGSSLKNERAAQMSAAGGAENPLCAVVAAPVVL